MRSVVEVLCAEVIEFLSDTLRYGNVAITGCCGHGIHKGVTAIVGRGGAGKTTLGTILEKGRYAFGNRLRFAREGMKVKMLKFTDIHSFTGVDVLRFDQRLESSENEYVPTVAEVMPTLLCHPRWDELSCAMRLADAGEKKINFLSSGELRKLLIINALLSEPDLLILDNPYIGLDAPARAELDTAIRSLGASVVLLLSDSGEIPTFTDHILHLDSCRIAGTELPSPGHISADEIIIPEAPAEVPEFEIAFSIADGALRYGDKTVNSGINWTVRRGEHWALTGPNGSGKSLLLSMICGDNPQAYSNHVTIFDRPRGSGESIWDIKERIGYVCPEMQLYFRSPLTVERIVVEGSRPWLHRFGAPSEAELATARHWLELLGISPLAERKFETLSSSEQRLVLLARAFVKQPAMLILDEPFQGLDAEAKERVRAILDRMLAERPVTLIFVTHYPEELPATIDKLHSLKP